MRWLIHNWAASLRKASFDFPSNQLFSAHALCKATCLGFWLKLHTTYFERTAYVLARLCGSVGLPEPLLFECAITAPFLWHGSYFNTWTGKVELQWLKHLWDHGNLFRNMGSSSHWGFIIAPGQEANGDNSRIPKYFDLLYKMLCCMHLLESPRWGDSYSIQNIQFHDKIRKVPQKSLYIYIYISTFLSYRKNFVWTQKRVRISQLKRAIRVFRVGDIEVRLYMGESSMLL